MKPIRLIKRHEMPSIALREEQPVAKPDVKVVANHWRKEQQRATPTTARRAFAALFPTAAA
ncbi:MAG: hypothetical protein U0Y68_07695 [Blastocatellia bacterium]